MTSAAATQTAAAALEQSAKVQQSHRVLQNIVHELRQPLSAIESIAYYLELILPRGDARAREHASRLQELVQQSNWILTCGLQLADPTPLELMPTDLGEMISAAVGRRAVQGEPEPLLDLDGDAPLLALDPGRTCTLIDNLFTLFAQWSSDLHPVSLRTAGTTVELSTSAPGYGSEASLGPGCALALLAARAAVEAHGGGLTITVDAVAGIRIKVEFAATVLI